MAGVKGKGGQKGRSGGARPGAGRKPKVKPEATALKADTKGAAPAENQTSERKDPLDFLADVYNDPKLPPNVRVRAAIAHAQYLHLKRHDGGKREEEAGAAKKAASGRYAAAAPPLRVVGKS